jgi:hypothetical protein
MEIFGNKKTPKNPKNPIPNIIIKIYRDACKYTAYFPNLESPKKGRSRFVGSFSFWTFLKNRKMSILQKRLLKFAKKRA